MAVFRLFKLALNALGLVVAWGLVDMGADPTFGLMVVFLIFGGNEVVETYLAASGVEDLGDERDADVPAEAPDGYQWELRKTDDN